MPDDIVNLTFSNSTSAGLVYSGNVNVDYSTQLVTGSVVASYDGHSNNFDLGSGVPLSVSAPQPGVTGSIGFGAQPDPSNIVPSLFLNWDGETPNSLSFVQYYYPGYQFPAVDFNAPVTSTVVSVCLASGCRVATERGEIAVEDLAVGDRVVTASGALRPIRWLGSRKFNCSHNERARTLRPVRIARDAFGSGKPCRDVLVSPGHSVCVTVVDEFLVRACDLVNGVTVAQVDRDEVVYWHVELDDHDVILAEGLPVESYLDVGNRSFFASVSGAGGRAATPATCRPMVCEGEILQAIRIRLRERALTLGWSLRDASMGELRLVTGSGVILPEIEGERARFSLAPGKGDVWLVSDASAPADVSTSRDGRALGVGLAELVVCVDGERRSVALDDPRLGVGLHATERLAEGPIHRWTDGRALLPASLWQGALREATLEVAVRGCVQRWAAPARVEAAAA